MKESLSRHFRMFALYNRWANKTLHAAAAELTPAQLTENRGAFFKSVLGTLNHIVVTDRIWLPRLEGTSPQAVALEEVLYEDREELQAACAAEDERAIRIVFGYNEDDYTKPLDYKTTSGKPFTQNICDILSHFFNHQTHHRGQTHDLIQQLSGKAPPLDLLAYQRFVAPNDAP